MNMKHMRTYKVLATAMLLSSCLFVSSNWAKAARDVISFVSVTDRTRPIILMDTQGNILQRLVIPGLKQLALSWAPDGNSFAYHAIQDVNFDIHVMDVRTQTSRQLTFDDSRDIWPSWSPNGKWISFASNRTGNSELYRMDIDNGNLIQLTDGQDSDLSAWSPDSQWIAFTSRASLFVMNAEGEKLRKLAGNVFYPDCAWSPDGKKIAFATNVGIFSIDVNGRNLRQLIGLDRQGLIPELAWSPSGKWIIYRLREIPGGSTLWILNTTGNEGGKPLENTRGLAPSYLDWMPEGFLSVSPSVEKQTTTWGRLKYKLNKY